MSRELMTPRIVRWLDRRVGGARVAKKTLDKVFPDHWSFMLGEVALYCFVVLVATGTYLTMFFSPSQAEVVYDGTYRPLQGVGMSEAFNSALRISFDVRAGIVIRQMHHWAALLFVAVIVAHLARIFFTGAFRRPRELNWMIGVTLLLLGMVNGFAGYSLLDDQLSGTGLRVANSIILSIPVVGTWISSFVFGGPFPGPDYLQRLYIAHVLLIPVLIAAVIGLHLVLVIRHKHTQFKGPGHREDNVVGQHLWPTYSAKAGGLFFIVTAVIAALGGLAQINPIWLTGPYRSSDVSSASQPDWYMGWLDGGLRLMPPFEISAWGYQIPNPFFPGVLLPGVVFTILYLWPFIEARWTKDREEHHLLDRPRDQAGRTAIGAGAFTFVGVMLLAGASDVISATFGLSVNAVIIVLRTALLLAPPLVAVVTLRVCRALQRRDAAADRPEDAGDDPPDSNAEADADDAAAGAVADEVSGAPVTE